MALNGQYTTVERVIEKLQDWYGFDEVDKISIIEHICDIAGYLNIPESFVDKFTTVDIENYRAALPTDFYSLNPGSVMEVDSACVLRESFDLMTRFDIDDDYSTTDVPDTILYTYLIKQGYIFTGLEETTLEIAYKAFPIDTDGYPMIPDDSKAIRAAVDYIAGKIAMKYWLKDRLSEVKYREIQQQTYFSMASYYTHSKMPSIDQMEGLKNKYLQLVGNPNHHDNNFKYLNSRASEGLNRDPYDSITFDDDTVTWDMI